MVCRGDVMASRHCVTGIIVIVNYLFLLNRTFLIGDPKEKLNSSN